MLSQLNPSFVVPVASAFLLAAFFLYVYLQKRQQYLLAWAAGWLLISLHFAVPILSSRVALPEWMGTTNEWLLAVAALAFYASARMYARLAVHFRAILAAAAGLAVYALAYDRHWIPHVSLGLPVALLFLLVARTF